MAKGDIRTTDAWQSPDGSITVVFRVTDEVHDADEVRGSRDPKDVLAKRGDEKSGTEHVCTATADELTSAGVDLTDKDAMIAYLGRGLIPADAPVKRTDLIGAAVSVDAVKAKESARLEAIEAAKAAEVDEAAIEVKGKA